MIVMLALLAISFVLAMIAEAIVNDGSLKEADGAVWAERWLLTGIFLMSLFVVATSFWSAGLDEGIAEGKAAATTREVVPQQAEIPDHITATVSMRKAHVRDSRAAYIAASTDVQPVVEPEPVWNHWDALAECESRGEWDYGPHSNWGNHLFEGGLQFHPGTWDAFKPEGYPEAAYQATREQQILVGERVQAAQGWKAWPACSLKIGLR